MMVGILLTMLFLTMFSFIKLDLMMFYVWIMLFGIMMLCFYNGFEFFHAGFIVDGFSVNLIILSIWISFLMIISSNNIMKIGEGFYKFLYLIFGLMFILVVTFLVNDLVMFYFFFEASLIPTLVIIMGWGYQPERIQAGVYFMFYTLTASLPLLLVSVYYFNLLGGVNLGDLGIFMNLKFTKSMSLILFLMTSMAFLVKLPMYFTHLWLPSAHVEAPVAGSMILAGVLLKLGGYGIIRVSFLLKFMMGAVVSILIGLGLFSMIYVGLMCCRLNDFKALVAYSSVAHMSMVISGSLIMNLWGIAGALMMMISHGLSSSGLFCIVNMFYERLSSRSFYINKGLLLLFPFLSLMMFLLSASNIAAPPTINLISEIFLMISIMGFNYLMILVFPLGSFLGAVFTIFMYSYSQHGKMFMSSFSFSLVNYRELHILSLHLIPVYFILVSTDLFLVK